MEFSRFIYTLSVLHCITSGPYEIAKLNLTELKGISTTAALRFAALRCDSQRYSAIVSDSER